MKLITTLIISLSLFAAASERISSTYMEDRYRSPYRSVKNGRAAEANYCFAVKMGKMFYMKLSRAVKLKALPFRYDKNARSYIIKTTGKAPQAEGLNATKGL